MRTIVFMMLAMIFVMGCQPQTVEEPLTCADAEPGLRDQCCAEENKDAITIACVGSWQFVEETGQCSFVCQEG